MGIKRYARAPVIMGGRMLGTSTIPSAIWNAVKSGTIESKKRTVQGVERLDIIAGEIYGDASLWWIIAAASGIGWGLQVPAGTILDIPTKLEQVNRLIG